jgi:putative FmdB family regulatory protein
VAVYEFHCAGCGPFELVRPMAESGAAACCPACGTEARRVVTPPRLARLAPPLRRALDTEEQSAHEPDVVTEKRGRPMPHRHAAAPPWAVAH